MRLLDDVDFLNFLSNTTNSPPHIQEHAVKTPGLETMMAGAESLPGHVVDYSKGPSALDKAMTTFLFTELVRGARGA